MFLKAYATGLNSRCDARNKQAMLAISEGLGWLECGASDGPIKAWSDGVSGHYEKRRRIEILEHARTEIMESNDPNDTFDAFNEGGPETSLPSVVPFQVDEEEYKDDAWGLDEPTTANIMDETADGWGLEVPG